MVKMEGRKGGETERVRGKIQREKLAVRVKRENCLFPGSCRAIRAQAWVVK